MLPLLALKKKVLPQTQILKLRLKENRKYIRGEFRESLGMNFSVPFSLKGSSKCTNHVNVNKLDGVAYINTVCSLDDPFQFQIF